MKVVRKKENKDAELIAGLKEQLVRALADYDNLRKRVEAEKVSWSKFASVRIIGRLLPVLDNLENMQKHLKDQGLAITILEFKKLLNEEGFKEVLPQPGEKFDENLMEALEVVEGGEEGTVAEVVLPGWMAEDAQVIRHAKVRVYKTSIEN